MGRYTCEDCGTETDDGAMHETWCPGSPDDRLDALERDVADLRAELDARRPTFRRILRAPRLRWRA